MFYLLYEISTIHNYYFKGDKNVKPLPLTLFCCIVAMIVFLNLFSLLCISFVIYIV
jgi:hypothetical protein